MVAADQQKQAGLEATPTATAARPIAAAAGVAADGSRPSVVGQDSRTRLSTGGKTREEEKPRSISLIPSLAIDPPTTSRPRTTIDARGHVVSQKVSPRPIESVVIAAAAADDDGSLSGDANKPQESPPPTWTNSLFSLLLPTHRASLSEGHAASDLSVREDTRSHPDLWPFRSAAASRSRSGAAGSKNLHPGIQDDTLADDEDEEDDDDGEISPEDVKLVLEEFGEEEPTTTTAGAPLSSEPVEATIINPAKMQAERAQAMRDEYEAKCGSLWKEYRACVQVSLKATLDETSAKWDSSARHRRQSSTGTIARASTIREPH